MDEKRFCTKCGAGLKPGDKFCAGCGNRVGETDSTAEHTGITAGHTGGVAGKNEKENRPQKTGKKIASWASGIGMILLIILLASGALDGMFYELTDGDFGKGNDNVKTVGNSNGGQNADEEGVTDLYRYRAAMEEVIIADLGFAKNDTGVYPSMEEMTFLFSEGNMYMISLGKSSVGKYSFLGVQVGDSMEQAKEGFQKFFTYESSSTTEDTVRDVYTDNEWNGMLMVEYGMSDGKISGITYTDMSEMTDMIYGDGMAEDTFEGETDLDVSIGGDSYPAGEIDDFSGEYANGGSVVLSISLGSEYLPSDFGVGESVGSIFVYTSETTLIASMVKQEINEYALYVEEENAVIGWMSVTEESVIITDSRGFDGTYELQQRYES